MTKRQKLLSPWERKIYASQKDHNVRSLTWEMGLAVEVGWGEALDALKHFIQRLPVALASLSLIAARQKNSGGTLSVLYKIWSELAAGEIKKMRGNHPVVPKNSYAEEILTFAASANNVVGICAAIMMGAVDISNAMRMSIISGDDPIVVCVLFGELQSQCRSLALDSIELVTSYYVLAAKYNRVRVMRLLEKKQIAKIAFQLAFERAFANNSHLVVKYLLRRWGNDINFEDVLGISISGSRCRKILMKYFVEHPGNEELIELLKSSQK